MNLFNKTYYCTNRDCYLFGVLAISGILEGEYDYLMGEHNHRQENVFPSDNTLDLNVEYFDDDKKEFWEKNGTFSAKLGDITISSEEEDKLREFLSKFE